MYGGGVHSGANPGSWCFNNLRKIDGAKAQLEQAKNLTNGTPVTIVEISPYVEGGIEGLKCYEKGKYSIGLVGTAPRCSVHGSLP
jgi:hypothetical protein